LSLFVALPMAALIGACSADDGEGKPADACSADEDCAKYFDDLGACEEGFCDEGSCQRRSRDDGSECGPAGCTADTPPRWFPPRTCSAGICLLSTASDCDDGKVCTGVTCDSTKGCGNPAKAGPCEDGSKCTKGDACKGGVCVGGAKTCECSIDKDCIALDDGNPCTGTMICNQISNTCLVDPGSKVSCNPARDTDCLESQCNPASGVCELLPLPSGTACDDGIECTANDGCQGGACVGEKVCE